MLIFSLYIVNIVEPISWDQLNEVHKQYVINHLSPDLLLHLVTDQIEDEDYWARRCLRHWPRAIDVEPYGFSYRRMYFELLLQRNIEHLVPGLVVLVCQY